MTSKLPSLTAKEVARIVKKCGFHFNRQKGSHQIWRHPDGRWTTIPMHPGENIGRGLLHQILKDLEITLRDFTKLLHKR